MVDQGNEWARGWAVTTGRCVKRWRADRELSAQKLADKCAALGMPSLTRTVITKLENGRKESVSTAELAVLAKALGVPPVMLMFPFGEQRMVEISLGEFIDPLDAAYWFAGQNPETPGDAADKGSALDLFMIHRRLEGTLLFGKSMWFPLEGGIYGSALSPIREVTLDDLAAREGRPPLPYEEKMLKEIQYHASVLRRTRDAIRKLGFEPPPLPPDLANLEREVDPDGSR